MYGFKAVYFCYTSKTEREKLIEVEEPQIDLSDLNDLGYSSFDEYAWGVAACKALRECKNDESLDSIEILYN